MNTFHKNSATHILKLYNKINNNLFNLMVDLEEESVNNPEAREINYHINYYIIQKILMMKNFNIDTNKYVFFDITFGKHKNNTIYITDIKSKKDGNLIEKSGFLIQNNKYNRDDIVKNFSISLKMLQNHISNNSVVYKNNSFKTLKINKVNDMYINNNVRINYPINQNSIININEVIEHNNKEMIPINNPYFPKDLFQNNLNMAFVSKNHSDKDRDRNNEKLLEKDQNNKRITHSNGNNINNNNVNKETININELFSRIESDKSTPTGDLLDDNLQFPNKKKKINKFLKEQKKTLEYYNFLQSAEKKEINDL